MENALQQVQVTPELSLSKVFADHWPEIEKTGLKSIHIEATPTEDLRVEQSKFGGQPWLPNGFKYPVDSEGLPMFLLAQLNFDEIPKLENYPETGILQFYISNHEKWMYGLDLDSPWQQDGFRVLYFEDVNSKEISTSSQVIDNFDNLPFEKPHSLQFKIQDEFVGMGDIRGENAVASKIEDWIEDFSKEVGEALETEAYDKFSYSGHKMGGYAYFTQQDPREDAEMLLLFQMDSDEEILWGDVGVANFFIHPEDLKKRDFSKVLYNWDCS